MLPIVVLTSNVILTKLAAATPTHRMRSPGGRLLRVPPVRGIAIQPRERGIPGLSRIRIVLPSAGIS
jgi:hypothetical protein